MLILKKMKMKSLIKPFILEKTQVINYMTDENKFNFSLDFINFKSYANLNLGVVPRASHTFISATIRKLERMKMTKYARFKKNKMNNIYND